MENSQNTAELTIVFLLYNAEKTIHELFQRAIQQVNPLSPNDSSWLKIVFMDDFSKDQTCNILQNLINNTESRFSVELIRNTPNLGLSRTINKACELVSTPYMLTCHCDSFFGTHTYAFEMLSLIKSHPNAAAITGKPIVNMSLNTPFSEKLNTIANLMDIFPEHSQAQLVPVGFAEGRCDIFNLDALHRAGLYDTTLRTSGEDQVLNAKLRELGYEIYLAPHVNYIMSVSTEQDSLIKIARHQWLFAKTSPYILFASDKSLEGIISKKAGKNRRMRAFLRIFQIFCTFSYIGIIFLLFFVDSKMFIVLWLAFIALIKAWMFVPYFKLIPTSIKEKFSFVLFQPLLDFSYAFGFLYGVIILPKLRKRKKLTLKSNPING